jgi:hypothetical protein
MPERRYTMTVFYRSRELVISHEEFTALFSPERYALTDLHGIHVIRGHPDARHHMATATVAGVLALAVAAGPLMDSPAAWVVTALALLCSVGVGGVSLFARRPRWQLCANYQGVDVCIYSTTDALTFGQVRRGLIRALEASRAARAAVGQA